MDEKEEKEDDLVVTGPSVDDEDVDDADDPLGELDDEEEASWDEGGSGNLLE